MKIKKSIMGEVYTFYIQLIPNTMKCNVRYFHSNEWIECDITNDLKHIIIPKGKEFKYDCNTKIVSKLRISKLLMLEILDYNSNHLKLQQY